MEFNRELADKMIDTLLPIIPRHFGKIQDIGEVVKQNEIEAAIGELDPLAEISYGASRMVIVSPNLEGVVIKIPFNGVFYLRYPQERHNLPFDEVYEFVKFVCYEYDDTCDYCEVELRKYQMIKEETPFARFFAKTEAFRPELTPVLGTILVQEESLPELFRTGNYKTSKKAEETASGMEDEVPMNSDWLALCIDEYGTDLVKDFFKYCEEEDDGSILEDCHDANYGYRIADRTPCIFDFASYFE